MTSMQMEHKQKKNVTNKLCIKTAINMWLKKLIGWLTRLKELIAWQL